MAKRNIEKTWQTHLAKAYQPCDCEVKTPLGRIDILTPTKLIEVKASKKWKDSIGQLIGYGKYYPDHQRCLFLFGDIDNRQLGEIRELCKLHNISLTICFDEELETKVVIRGLTIAKNRYTDD